MYSGYCSPFSFITHVTDFDFMPLAGLRGVTMYHPLAVIGQFDQRHELLCFTDASDYRFLILSPTETSLARVYGF